jgi:hypothetical protein
MTTEQATWLQQFQWHNLGKSHGENLLQRMSNKGFYVFPNHAEEWNHNKSRLLEANKNFPIAKFNAVGQGHSKTTTANKAAGLHRVQYTFAKQLKLCFAQTCVSNPTWLVQWRSWNCR